MTPLKAQSIRLTRTRVAVSVIAIAASLTVSGNAQSSTADSSAAQAQVFSKPVNLKVLSKNLTGQQVHDIMEKWNVELGVRCGACHVRDLDGIIPGGSPNPRFADDSKPMKGIARIMYTMTEEINRKFITGDDGAPGPVTCGTCHRGNISPEPFASPQDGQRSAQAPPPGAALFLR
jgi:mono/diheme cytochrome c family protein